MWIAFGIFPLRATYQLVRPTPMRRALARLLSFRRRAPELTRAGAE
jgi:hypothetical protein